MSVTVAAPGLKVGGSDRLELFLKVFSGEVLTAFSNESVTKGKFMERTINHGKAATFPVLGRAKAQYLSAGNNLDDLRANIQHNEKLISIDGLLTSDCMIFDLDDAMNHYDVRAPYSAELGKSLARALDGAVLAEVAKAAINTTANIPDNTTTGVKGTGVGGVVTATVPNGKYYESPEMGVVLFEQLLKIKTKMANNYIPNSDRYVFIKPMALNALLAQKDVLNKLYGAQITMSDNKPPRLLGFDLIETPDLCEGGADNSHVIQGAGHVFPSAYATSCQFLACHKSAIGILSLKGLGMEHSRRANYQADEFIAKYAKGIGELRPEAAFLCSITEAPAPTP